MRHRNNSDKKLIIYIIVSLIIHLSFFYFLPLSDQAGMASQNEKDDFGFIQVVDYQPSIRTATKEQKKESKQEIPQKKNDEETEKSKDSKKTKEAERESAPESKTKNNNIKEDTTKLDYEINILEIQLKGLVGYFLVLLDIEHIMGSE
jgi:protein TonB